MSIHGDVSGRGWGRVNLQDSFKDSPATDMDGKPKRIGHNRFSYVRADGATVYRLRHTDVLIRQLDGRQILNSGGWKTVTTKKTLNEYLVGASVYSDKGVWYVHERNTGRKVVFYDQMILPEAFIGTTDDGLEQHKLIKRINMFCRKVDTEEYDVPRSGDCWLCHIDGAGQSTNTSHLLSHIDEGYLHGTLILNALKWAGYNPQCTFRFQSIVKRALRRYLKHRLGIG